MACPENFECPEQITGGCPVSVHDNVCVEAQVRIKPCVDVGPIQTFCLGNPSFDACEGELLPECTFRVSQRICVQIPLTFAAIACAEPTGIVCDTPGTGDCQTELACTFSIGHFRNTPSLTNELITAAGGTIILGTEIGGVLQGLSIAATTENANAILSFNPPPPAPADPPLAGQYANLYAQLLAANLNVLNGATCPAALAAIANANAFIASSPPGGTTGAPGFQEPLAEFNSGEAPGCPLHCPED